MSAPAPGATLVVQRRIGAPAARLFEAWTRPEHLTRWWGPEGSQCTEATVDLRVGGAYRIANRFGDGQVVWIIGEFELVEPPRKLVYSWSLSPGPETRERVTILFEEAGDATVVTVRHEQIGDAQARDGHEAGWRDCLAGLARHFGEAPPP
jgi:uncharacterized protein YndB with AHSA1/START domain